MNAPRNNGLPAGPEGYNLGDAVNDMLHLWRLLDVAVETAVNVPRDNAAREDLARLDACIWIARDVARNVRRQLEMVEINGVDRPQRSEPVPQTIASTELTADQGRSLAAAFDTISDVAYGLACQPRFKHPSGGQNAAGDILTRFADEAALQHDRLVDGLTLSVPSHRAKPRAKANAPAV